MAAFGLETFEEFLVKVVGSVWGKRLNVVGITLLFVFLAGISHLIFIDHTPEYPWERRKYLFWMIEPNKAYQLWSFGFPYYRDWEGISEYVTSTDDIGFFASNEKKSITSFYVPQQFDVDGAGYYIHIYHPQSFKETVANRKIRYWTNNYDPVKVFEINGRVLVEIYDMPPGTIEELKRAGY